MKGRVEVLEKVGDGKKCKWLGLCGLDMVGRDMFDSA